MLLLSYIYSFDWTLSWKINRTLIFDEAIIFTDKRRGLCVSCPNNNSTDTKHKQLIYSKDGDVGTAKETVEKFFDVHIAHDTKNYYGSICRTCTNK